MKIGIGNDHKGFVLKQKIIAKLSELDYDVIDYGSDDAPIDYPLIAFNLGKNINNFDLGILICGTGIGMSIACNKVKNIRCAKVCNKEEAILSRSHNDANVISINYELENWEEIITAFLETRFSNEERHIKRVKMIDEYTN